MVETAAVGLTRSSRDFRIVTANRKYAEMIGKPLDQIIGHPLKEVIGEQAFETIRPRVERVLRGESLEYEADFDLPTTGPRTVRIGYTPDIGADGSIVGWVASLMDVTELKQAERKAVRLAEQMRLVTDAVPALVSYVDAEGRYRFNNRAYRDWFGHDEEQLRGKHMREVLGDEAFDRLRPHVERALSGQRVYFRATVPYKQGGTRHIESEYIPDVQTDGSVAGFYALIRDISQRNEAEELLNRERELLQTIVDGIPVMITIYDPDKRVLRVNREFERVVGWSAKAAANMSLMEACYPDPAYREEVSRFMQSCREGWKDIRMRTRDGRDVETSWANIRLSDDTQVGIGIDITERKRAEEKLRRSEALYRTLGEAAPDFVWISDATGHVEYANARWMEYSGLTLEELNSAGWEALIHPQDRTALAERWAAATRIGEPFEAEVRYRRRDGIYRWFWGRALPLKNSVGRVERWVGTVIDVTERRRMEETLREADRRKNDFLATLAHELRNPLAPIRNAVQILNLRGSQEPAMQSARDVIDRQLQHMVRLIDDLMDVSRITRGKLELRKERVALASVIEQALEASRPDIEQAQHHLTVQLPPGPVELEADPVRLAQVFSNLLNNAAKYTDRGGRIALTAAVSSDEAIISVRDSGIGILPAQMPQLFEIFSQAASQRARSRGGLGIGLSLVRDLVQMHGGSVEARSEGEGKGSEFLVRLPVARSVTSPGPAIEQAAQTPRSEVRRVLVVDDNRDSADSLAALMRLSGHEVQTAYDGLEALERAQAFRPQVVVLDLGMPHMDGLEACRALRREPWGRDLAIVALTGWGQAEDRRRSEEAGFDAHLVKPVDHSAMVSLIGTLYRDRAVRH
jgi:PAS domain S-box-containing protein